MSRLCNALEIGLCSCKLCDASRTYRYRADGIDGYCTKLFYPDSYSTICRVRTDDMELLSSSLKEEATSLRQEEENMKEYKSELDLLLAEKLHHVEILRQIHSDINMVCRPTCLCCSTYLSLHWVLFPNWLFCYL